MPDESYFGYVPSTTRLDWGKMTSDIADELTKAYQSRDLARQELDNIKTANDQLVSSVEQAKTSSIDDKILQGADSARETMLGWNKDLKAGLLSARDYKARMNSLKNDWTMFANSMKGFDARMQSAIQRQQPDELGNTAGSQLEADINEEIAALGNLKNQMITFDKNSGKMYTGTVDGETGVYDPNTLKSASSIANIQNTVDNRFDLLKQTKQYVDLVANWKTATEAQGGVVTVRNAMLNPSVKRSVDNFVGSVVNDPRTATSVLLDNTDQDFQTYFNENQFINKWNKIYNEKVSEMQDSPKYSSEEIQTMVDQYAKRKTKGKRPSQDQIRGYQMGLQERKVGKLTDEEKDEIEKWAKSRLIKVSLIDNTYQPELTPDQKEVAEQVVKDQIFTGIPNEQTLTGVSRRSAGKSTGTKSKSEIIKKQNYGLYTQALASWYDATTKGDVNKINAMLADKGYVATVSGGKVSIAKNLGPEEIKGIPTGKIKYGSPIQINDLRSLAPYIGYAKGTGTKSAEAYDVFDAQKAAYEADQNAINTGAPSKGGSTPPSKGGYRPPSKGGKPPFN